MVEDLGPPDKLLSLLASRGRQQVSLSPLLDVVLVLAYSFFRFLRNPLIIRVPLFLIFSFNKETAN